jgi:hypothetical protein
LSSLQKVFSRLLVQNSRDPAEEQAFAIAANCRGNFQFLLLRFQLLNAAHFGETDNKKIHNS